MPLSVPLDLTVLKSLIRGASTILIQFLKLKQIGRKDKLPPELAPHITRLSGQSRKHMGGGN